MYSRGPAGTYSWNLDMNSSTAGSSRATPNAGGSLTVSEASFGPRAAASSETTPPYE